MVSFIYEVEEHGQQPDAKEPLGPQVFQRPEERHPFQEAEEQGWIADWRKHPAHITHHEDEEHDMVGLDAVLVEADEWANQ